ncbi:MAG: hypothetical protein II602_03925 [Erysipelotrichales bacterium]|nr:hypothetical protein [Erysipelotrichales bacterium]
MVKLFRKMNGKQRKTALWVNAVICVLEVIGFYLAFKALGVSVLKYYTQLSNFLLTVGSALLIAWILRHPDKEIPRWLGLLKLIGTLSVSVTFIVVITVLSWTMPISLWDLLTQGSMLYHHTICPVLGMLSFVLWEPFAYRKKDAYTAVKRHAVYAAFTIPLNILRLLNGPYPFLKVYEQPWWASVLWVFIILGGNVLLAKLWIFLNRKFARRHSIMKGDTQ